MQTLRHQDGTASKVTSVSEVISSVRRKIVPLGIWVVVCAGLGLLYSFNAPIFFNASTAVLLEPRQSVGLASAPGSIPSVQSLDVAQAESQIQVIKSERTLSEVFKALDLQHSQDFKPSKLGFLDILKSKFRNEEVKPPVESAESRQFQAFTDRVNVRRIGQSYVLEITYQAGTPDQAARVANSIAMQYIKGQIDVKVAAALQGTEYLRDRISNLVEEQRTVSNSIKLGTIPITQLPNADARIISAALPPLNKSFPKPTLIVGLATTIGLLTGVFAVLAIGAFDKRVWNKTQVERTFGFEYIHTVPKVKNLQPSKLLGLGFIKTRRNSLKILSSSLHIRRLLADILAHKRSDGNLVCGIVSWTSGTGKTTISAALCMSAVSTDSDLLLLDANVDDLVVGASSNELPHGYKTDGISGGQFFWQQQKLDWFTDDDSPTRKLRLKTANASVGLEKYYHAMKKSIGQHFDGKVLIVDLPALASNPECCTVISSLDVLVFVAEAGSTTVDDIAEALKLTRSLGVENLIFAVNKI